MGYSQTEFSKIYFSIRANSRVIKWGAILGPVQFNHFNRALLSDDTVNGGQLILDRIQDFKNISSDRKKVEMEKVT